MITLDGFPKNKDKYIKLLEFFKETLGICNELGIAPILDGSLAVFAYTRNQDMDVNDVDVSVPEAEFPRIIKVLEQKGIGFRLKEWHVLQALRDDLKIELGSQEYWSKDLPKDYEILLIDNYRVKMLSLHGLKEFYKQGMEDRAKGTEENDKIKYERLKAKYEMLVSVGQKFA